MDNLFNRVARRRRQDQSGFTLIELLVVIAVLAILAAIVLFNVVGVTNRGEASACATDVKTFQTAVDAAIGDALSDGNPQPDAASTAGKLTVNTTGINTGNITTLSAGSYVHDSAGKTACATSLTFAWTNTTDYTKGMTVAGS